MKNQPKRHRNGDTKQALNLEAQNVTSKFTYKRHLFYGALAYAFGLQAGEDYAALQPTISIVLYKNKTGSELFQNAKMSGSLIRTKEDEELFSLLSVNTAKWKDAKSTKLKQLLAILHNGHYSPKTANLFKGVDVDSDFFKKFSRAVLISSAEVKFKDCESKGDLEMSSMLKGYLTEEQEKEAEAKGEVKGKIKLLYTDFNMSVEDIARKLDISQSKVSSVLEDSGLIK